MRKDEVIAALRLALPSVRQRYHVRRLALFGSVARGEQTGASDIDVLVEFDEPIGFFDFVRLEAALEDALHTKVDLVSAKALKPVIRDEVLRQAVYV